jgi:malate dehydrogenase
MLAIAGTGPVAGALAQRAASRERFTAIRLIDPAGTQAAGKALDIRQAGPVDGYDTRTSGHTGFDAAAGATVVAIADRFDGTEWEGDAGLAMLRSLLPMIGDAPLVFTGARQLWLMEAAHRELKVPVWRMAGSAPMALEAALRALTALALDGSPADINLRAYGRPPDRIVIGWSSAVAAGSPLESVLPLPDRVAIAARAKGLWPPGPTALGSAAARVAEAFASGSRQDLTCAVVGDGAADAGDNFRLERGVATAVPVRIGRGRILKVKRPALSTREQVEFENAR